MKFLYNAPTKVIFGEVTADAILSELVHYGKRVLILTGGKSTSIITKRIIELLETNVDLEVFNGIPTNPPIELIENISQKATKPDVILTIGGGSVHDAGKALSIALTHSGSIETYTVDGEYSVTGIKNILLPVITIPTVSGTGAEVSPASLVRVREKKRIIFSPFLYPVITFIDVSFAKSLSLELCINTALDALVQGVESYVSTESQSFSQRFSISAIERIVISLLNITQNGFNQGDLEQIALASIESLYAVGQTTVGAVHAISDPLSGIYNIHHGEAVATLLPYVADVNYIAASNKYDELKVVFENLLKKPYYSFPEAIYSFYNLIGFDITSMKNKIKEIGDFENRITQCVNDSFNNDMVGNPRKLDSETIIKILNKVLV
jgi:alcohol dehydrogenase class IV